MKFTEYVESLPRTIMFGEEITIPDTFFRKLFSFISISEKDIFYHIGCGLNNSLKIAIEEFNIKKAVGIENRESIANQTKKNTANIKNIEIINDEFDRVNISNATIVFFLITKEETIQKLLNKFERELKNDARIITLWSPPCGIIPDRVDFPFIECKKPFKYSKNVKKMLKKIYGTSCIDFTTSWLLAEKYIKIFDIVSSDHIRFVNMLLSMVIWINSWNEHICCEDDIPPPVESYLGILKTFFGLDLTDMIIRKKN